jgi:RHS repeat-associated protein
MIWWMRHGAHVLGVAVVALIVGGGLASPSLASADCTTTWIGPPSGGSWATASYWSSGVVPSASDAVCLPAGATVTVNSSATFLELQGSDASLRVQGGTLDMSNATSVSHIGSLTQSGGTIRGSGQLHVANSFSFGGGGTMSGSGSVVVDPAGSGQVADGTLDAFTLRNDGSLTQSSSSQLWGKNGAVLDNRGTYTFNAERCSGCSPDAGILWTPNGDKEPQLRNTGTFRRTTGTNSSTVSFGLDNDGVVSVEAAYVSFKRGASGEASTGRWTGINGGIPYLAGAFTLASGSQLSGTVGVVSGGVVSAADIQGMGATLNVQSGTLALTDPAGVSHVATLSQSGGAINGPGQMRVASSFFVGGNATMSGAGSVVVEANATGQVADATIDNFTLRNDGSLNQDASSRLFGKNGAVLDNRGIYTLNAERCSGCGWDPGILWTPNGDKEPRLRNTGTFRRTTGTRSSTVSFGLDNDGVVSVEAANVWFMRGASGETSTGRWTAINGGIPYLAGAFTLASGSQLSGTVDVVSGGVVSAADIQGTGATLNVQSGTLALTDPAGVSHVATLSQTGGTIKGPGQMRVGSSFFLGGDGTMSGSGSVVVESGATGEVQDATLDAFTLRNDGSLTQGDSRRLFGKNGAVLDNRGTYTLNAERCSGCSFNTGLVLASPSDSALLENRGTFQKTQGTGTSTVYWQSENLGTIRQLSGILKFYGAFVLTAPQSDESYGPGSTATPTMRRSCSGKPVECATGNQFEVQTDLTAGGRGLGLTLTRTYNSQAAANQMSPGPFGYGWTTTYGDRLVMEAAQHRATVIQADGSRVPFIVADDGTITAPFWVQAKLVKNSDGTCTYTLPDQQQLSFDASGRLATESDRNGNTTTMTYDPDGQLTKVTDPAGRSLSYTYSSGMVDSITDPSGLTVHYAYAAGALASVTYEGDAAATWAFTYDAANQLTGMTDARGNTTTTAYDGQHRAIRQTDAVDRLRTWDYLTDETRITEPNGSVTDLVFANGQPTKIVRAAGTSAETTQRLVYDSKLRNTEVMDGNGHTTTFTYDADGNRTSATDPTGRHIQWTYDATHDVLTATTNSGLKTTIDRDTRGNPTAISRTYTDSGGTQGTQRVTMAYDTHGQPTSLKDPLLHETTFAYDDAGNQIAQTAPDGQKTTATFDANSRIVSTTSPRGNEAGATPSTYTTTITRDKFGRAISVRDPLGRTTSTTYDTNGNVTSVTDGAGRTTHATYDAEGQLTKETLGDGSTRELTYDASGAVASRTDGRGKTTIYHYDDAGNRTETIDPLARHTLREYDKAGNVVREIDALQRVTTYTYDAADRPTTISYPGPDAHDVGYAYDADGRRSSMTDAAGTSTYDYDGLGRLVATHTASGKDVTFAYDLADRRTSIGYPNGHTVAADYDASGRLTAITDWLGHTTTFSYDADGQLARTGYPTSPSTTDQYEYDPAGQLTGLSLGEAGGAAPQLGYGYTSGGELAGITSTGLPGDATQSYEYDDAGRLAKEGLQQLAYDLAGNVTKLPTGVQLSYDAAGQLTTATSPAGDVAFDFDAVGQRVAQTPVGASPTTFGYDGSGKLASVAAPGTDTVTYRYDGDGLRTETRNGVSVTRFVWDPSTSGLLAEDDTSYLYGPDGPFEEIGGNGTARFYHHDRLGSVRTVTDTSGDRVASQTFDAYGNVVASTGSRRIPFGFASQYTDPDTGLIYMRARFYDPKTAQFLTRDPLEQLTEQAYQYAGDDPVNATDPLGLFPRHLGLPSLEDISNAAAHFGDSASFGLTRKIRQALGVDAVDYCSAAYRVGGIGGTAIQLAIPVERLASVSLRLARVAKGSGALDRLAVRLADEIGAVGRYGNLGNLASRADETLADVIRSRGGGASQLRQLQTGYGERTLGEISDLAASGDREAVRAIKMAKQAGSQGKGGR